MKRNLTVLALLVTCSLLSSPLLTYVAYAEDIPLFLGSDNRTPLKDLVIEVAGFEVDGFTGDPGDAGDGLGAHSNVEAPGNSDGNRDTNAPVLDEYLRILMSLIQMTVY